MPVGHAVTATSDLAPSGVADDERGCRLWRGIVADDAQHQVHDLLLAPGAAEAGGEVRLHQRPGELGEQLEVGRVAAGRGRDQEGEVGGAVLGSELHRRARAGRRPASGSSTAVVRQWGIAMPPARPVGAVPSRVIASAASWSGSAVRPASATIAASARMTSCFSAPRSASSPHQRAGDEVGHGHSPGGRSRRVTWTSSVRPAGGGGWSYRGGRRRRCRRPQRGRVVARERAR